MKNSSYFSARFDDESELVLYTRYHKWKFKQTKPIPKVYIFTRLF